MAQFLPRLSSSGSVRLVSLGSLPLLSSKQYAATKSQYLGTNLLGVNYFTSTRPFIDLMKCASDWVTSKPTFNPASSIGVDGSGYISSILPTQRVSSYLFAKFANGISDHNTSGNYMIVYYDGDGSGYGTNQNWWFESQGGGVTEIEHDTVNKRLVLSIDYGTPAINGKYLILNQEVVNEANYLTNIRCIPGEFDALYASGAGEIFHPEYLDFLRHFSCLRFMDWNNCNGSDASAWEQRRTGSHRNFGGNSWTYAASAQGFKPEMVPYEYQVALCNKLGVDLWTNTPYNATTDWDWSTQLATYLVSALSSNLKVYIERGNEAWNGIFDVQDHDYDQGQIAYSATEANVVYRGYKWSAHCALGTMSSFENVFSSTEDSERLQTLFAWQKGTDGISKWLANHEGLADHIKHWALAPYAAGQLSGTASKLGTNPQATVSPVSPHTLVTSAMTVDQIIDTMYLDLVQDVYTHSSTVGVMALSGINSITYEQGQHLVGVGPVVNVQTITDLFSGVNTHPRFRDWQYQYLNTVKNSGFSLMSTFIDFYTITKYGSWGLKTYQGQPDSECPKYLGTLDWIRDNP